MNIDSTVNPAYHAWLASALFPSGIAGKLLNTYGSPEEVFRAFVNKDADAFCSITGSARKTLEKNSSASVLSWWKEVMEKNGISAITYMDELYPASLRDFEDLPSILFYQGDISCLERKRIISVIGSRRATYDGLKAAEKVARSLSEKNVTVISGFAAGIDTAAHRGCLKGNSPTAAFMGCGLDRCYPAENAALRNEILNKGGLLISEFSPGEPPAGWHFPHRNRLISGASKATVLIEARIKSGSISTVQHALEQGREVFVYPGDPGSPAFEGNHILLREGARFFTKAEDILDDLGWLDNTDKVGQNNHCEKGAEPSGLSPEQNLVYQTLKRGRLSFDQLCAHTRLSPSELFGILTVLQINGIIEVLPGKMYQIKND